MSFTDTFRDFYESLTASTELHAETAAADEEEDSSNDNEGEEKDGGDDEEAEAAGGDGDGEEEEEEEEEEEPEDIKPKLEEGTFDYHARWLDTISLHQIWAYSMLWPF